MHDLKTKSFPSHLYTIAPLTKTQIETLMTTAQHYIDRGAHVRTQETILKGRTVATVFFSDSTRTRLSFSLAAKRLGADVLDFNKTTSSMNKGESIEDTLQTLIAMGADTLIIRHPSNDVIQNVIPQVSPNITIINAGSFDAHPTQGLLDLLTIRQKKPDIHTASFVIVGDILHSRVVPSDVEALKAMGASRIRFVGPSAFLPKPSLYPDIEMSDDLEAALKDADVVMLLRIQQERLTELMTTSIAEYHQQFGLTSKRLQLAKSDAIVLHPGPMNRGVEITDEVADGPQSMVLAQVTNGVALRMSVLRHFVNKD